MQRGRSSILWGCILSICVGFALIIHVQRIGRTWIVPSDQLAHAPYALVLGANIQPDGTPSDALLDRVATGVQLYQDEKVDYVILSGDDGARRQNEVAVMHALTRESGVPEDRIIDDPHGYRTYESCKRTAERQGLTRVIVVTQAFHLPRALYLCRAFGLEAEGVKADRRTYAEIRRYTLRDYAASIKAWLDLTILHPRSPVQYDE